MRAYVYKCVCKCELIFMKHPTYVCTSISIGSGTYTTASIPGLRISFSAVASKNWLTPIIKVAKNS